MSQRQRPPMRPSIQASSTRQPTQQRWRHGHSRNSPRSTHRPARTHLIQKPDPAGEPEVGRRQPPQLPLALFGLEELVGARERAELRWLGVHREQPGLHAQGARGLATAHLHANDGAAMTTATVTTTGRHRQRRRRLPQQQSRARKHTYSSRRRYCLGSSSSSSSSNSSSSTMQRRTSMGTNRFIFWYRCA